MHNPETDEIASRWPLTLSGAEIDTLMAVASDTVAWCAEGHPGAFTYEHYADSSLLASPYATFVTLRCQGDLRGCMGTIEPVAPLRASVHQNAANAATRDPRFGRVASEELPGLKLGPIHGDETSNSILQEQARRSGN